MAATLLMRLRLSDYLIFGIYCMVCTQGPLEGVDPRIMRREIPHYIPRSGVYTTVNQNLSSVKDKKLQHPLTNTVFCRACLTVVTA